MGGKKAFKNVSKYNYEMVLDGEANEACFQVECGLFGMSWIDLVQGTTSAWLIELLFQCLAKWPFMMQSSNRYKIDKEQRKRAFYQHWLRSIIVLCTLCWGPVNTSSLIPQRDRNISPCMAQSSPFHKGKVQTILKKEKDTNITVKQ